MTVADVLSFIVALLALSAFFIVAIVMTIFLVRETEYHPARGLEPSGGCTSERIEAMEKEQR